MILRFAELRQASPLKLLGMCPVPDVLSHYLLPSRQMDGVFFFFFFLRAHTLPDNKFLPLVFGGGKMSTHLYQDFLLFFFFPVLRLK